MHAYARRDFVEVTHFLAGHKSGLNWQLFPRPVLPRNNLDADEYPLASPDEWPTEK